MTIVYDSKSVENLIVRVVDDPWRDHPREDDALSHMVTFHKRYEIGDEHSYGTYFRDEDCDGWEDIERILHRDADIAIIYPLYLFDHSVQHIKIGAYAGAGNINSHAYWDSGKVGYVYVTKDAIRKWWGIKRVTKKYLDLADHVLRAEVDALDHYISGELYQYEVLDPQGDDLPEGWENGDDCEVEPSDYRVESGSGYYTVEEAMEEGELEAKHLIEWLKKSVV